MSKLPRSLLRISILSVGIVVLCALTLISHTRKPEERWIKLRDSPITFQFPFTTPPDTPSANPSNNLFHRLNLPEKQCRTTFPGFFSDIDRMVSHGPFPFHKSDPNYKGLIQGRIHNGNLHILTAAPDVIPQILHQRTAVLHQLHRALLTSPTSEPLPDTYFAFAVNDNPKNNSWAFAKPNIDRLEGTGNENIWLMPGFQFWSWPSINGGSGIGTFSEAMARIDGVEEDRRLVWADDKIDKVVWRGTPHFNTLGNPTLRSKLLAVTRGKEWADVKSLHGGLGEGKGKGGNKMAIEEFCRFKYVVYTEGVTYSGRLPYHQACESVLITPRLTYVTTSSTTISGVVAEDLMALFNSTSFEDPPQEPAPFSLSPRANPEHTKSQPKTHRRPRPLLEPIPAEYWQHANAIYVDSDFSNLEATILFLRKHPEVARRIARNQRNVNVEQGYLSPAAEACYWRALIRGWASVAVPAGIEDDEDVSSEQNEAEKQDAHSDKQGDGKNRREERWGDELGESFETWILREVVEGSRRARGYGFGHG